MRWRPGHAIDATQGFHLARVDPDAPAASLGRAEADRLAYWLRAYAMRWYREGNALQKHRLVDDRLEADGCGECGGELVQSWADAMGRRARGFACPACLQRPPRPQAVDPLKATWPRPRARVQAPPTAAAALLLPRGGDHGHTCAAPREKLVRVSWPPPWGWRLEYRCGATGCKARGYCDELFANWPTCRCHGREEKSGLPYNVAMVDRISTGDRRGELYFQCRHKSSCEKFCGVGRNALSKSGLSAADQARIKEDFGFVKEKCKPLSCCGKKKAKGLKKPKKPRAKK